MSWIDNHAGIILAIFGLVAFFDGLPRLAGWHKHSTKARIWLTVYTICTLCAVIFGYRASVIQDQKEAAIEATAVSASTEAGVVDTRTSPRTLSPNVELAMASALASYRGTTFNLNEQSGSPEARNFGDEIGAVLKRAGWQAVEYVPDTFSTQKAPLVIYYRPTAEKTAAALANLLQAYGYNPEAIPDTAIKPGTIGVWIGAKS